MLHIIPKKIISECSYLEIVLGGFLETSKNSAAGFC